MLALFGAGEADAAATGILMTFITVMLVVLAIVLAIQIFYCLTLSKALHQVRSDLRELEPGQVWLLLIPLFNLYWVFVVTSKVPASLKAEFRDRGMGDRGDDYGAGIGKWYAICTIASIIPFIGGLIGLVGFVLWIMFWIKIAGYSGQLRSGGGDYDDDDRPRKRSRDLDDDEDDDDRPRKKKKRTDDYDDE